LAINNAREIIQAIKLPGILFLKKAMIRFIILVAAFLNNLHKISAAF
jgi:hypothetical protein